jgi:hypothetical protein
MVKVLCPKCSHTFNASDITVPKFGAAAASAAGGAYFGSSIGLAGGPIGAMAGTIPFGIIFGVIGFLGASKFTKCPKCGKVFKK